MIEFVIFKINETCFIPYILSLSNNNINDNNNSGVWNYSSYDIDAKNNWWGEIPTAQMNLGGNPKNISYIYDKYDDGNRGTVNYSGWLNSENGVISGSGQTGIVSFINGTGERVDNYRRGPIYIKVEDIDNNYDMNYP